MLDSIGLGFYLAGKSIMFYGVLFTLLFLILYYFEVRGSKRVAWFSLLSGLAILVLMAFFGNSSYFFLVTLIWAWIILVLFLFLLFVFIKEKKMCLWKQNYSNNKKLLFVSILLLIYLVYLQYRYYLAVTGFFQLNHANLLFDSFKALLFPF